MEEEYTSQENKYLEEARESSKVFDDKTDFLGEAKSIISDNDNFWYDYCAAMRDLPESKSMDLRENGRIRAAVYAANRGIEIAPQYPGVWGEKYLALNMLVHGLSSNLNAMHAANLDLPSQLVEKFKEALAEIRKTLDGANKRFPDDEWFMENREDLIECFGEY